jgi:hypothetical protein
MGADLLNGSRRFFDPAGCEGYRDRKSISYLERFADAAIAGFFQDYCTQKGVTFTGERVTAIGGKGRASSVMTQSGKEFLRDFVA